ncbi:MAG: ArnT family glycosyltransferase [Candidatus Tectimicrobiota bacterium]
MLQGWGKTVMQWAACERSYRGACLLLFLYAGALLSIGMQKDWRLRHEDNGAFFSALALAHLHLGLAETRAHDVFYNPHTGEKVAYGHHPPGLALLLAAVFRLAGSEAPWAARLLPILFHLGSLCLLLLLLRLFWSRWRAWLGGLLLATLPQSAYFGRMVGYEPLGLFAVMLQLYAYSAYRLQGRRGALALLAAGVVFGGCIDWPPLYFSLGLCVVEFIGWCRGRREAHVWSVLALAGLGIAVFDLGHLVYANGSLERLKQVAFANPLVLQRAVVSPGTFLLSQLEVHRRFYTHAGLLSSLLTLGTLLWPRLRLIPAQPPGLRTLLGVCFGAGLAYLVCIAGYAMSHQYSQFYLLPAVILAMLCTWEALAQLRRRLRPRLSTGLAMLCVLDVLVTSAVTLHYRHTRPEAYALRTTARLRATSLLPPYPGTPER